MTSLRLHDLDEKFPGVLGSVLNAANSTASVLDE